MPERNSNMTLMEVLGEVPQVFEVHDLLEKTYQTYLIHFLDEVFHPDDQEHKQEERHEVKILNMISR